MVKSLPLHPLLKKKASVFEDMVPGSPEVRMFFLAVPPPFRKRASSRPPKKRRKKLPKKFGRYASDSLPLQPLSASGGTPTRFEIFERVT